MLRALLLKDVFFRGRLGLGVDAARVLQLPGRGRGTLAGKLAARHTIATGPSGALHTSSKQRTHLDLAPRLVFLLPRHLLQYCLCWSSRSDGKPEARGVDARSQDGSRSCE